jgi:hypothetical protein
MPQLLDLRLQFGDRLFEFQETQGHAPWRPLSLREAEG